MTTQSIKPRRALATLKLPRNAPTLIAYSIGIVRAMTGNAYFATPNPPIATMETAIDDLQTAQTVAQTRAHGASALRDEKRAALVTLLEVARAYVQSIADTNPESGGSIIQSAGMALRKVPVRAPRGFSAKLGSVSGSVKIVAPAAAARAAYEWQYSTDAGKTWVSLPSTMQSKTSMTGLAPQAAVQFRYRALTKAGEGDWSAAISIFVL